MKNRTFILLGSILLFLIISIAVQAENNSVPSATDSMKKTEKGTEDVHDLPLFEVKKDSAPSTNLLGILISGDGGWWTLDSTVSEIQAAHGIPVVGISSHRYFATPRTPESTTEDMARVLRFYAKTWKKERFVLMGYSLGGEIIPFVANRLPDDLKSKVATVVMISPSKETMFEFHTTDWVHTPSDRKMYPVQPEIEKLYGTGMKLICTTSDEDGDCICGKLDTTKLVVVSRKGDHHYNDDFAGLGEAIWNDLKDVK